MSAFRVGQKVVCIKRGPWRLLAGPGRPTDEASPQFNGVYTVAAVIANLAGQSALVLSECAPFSAWVAKWFKPVAYPKQTLEADLAKFKDITAQAPLPAKEPVA